ncbi:phospholipase D-like domain-containing protein [Limobrevibacterium gyesilva]|uniref:Phospholipase D n=1 Tax=Limobrevibacterium gyesilva TaxID=2991712 RepID=A0AA41YHJ7_9PROT|nr:phospholipase D-like domain-containing protein [Limobrevibacterium gyesilva]MCW3473474.1 phospholipase D-like domain-containing protein [Limobrevibacterium gyesilva]
MVVRRIVLTLLLAGCVAEPRVALDPAAAPPDALQQQLALQQALDKTPLLPGNRVALLHDGAQTLPAMFAAMAAARDHINLEYYTFDDVRVGGQTLGDLLTERMRQGVAVNVIYDSYGSRDTPTSFLDRLRQAGARLTAFSPLHPLEVGRLTNPNRRDHRKIMVIDGRTAFVGGINLDHVYENPAGSGDADDTAEAYWHDTDARIDGPAVAELQRLFMDTWAQQKGAPLPQRDWFPKVPAQGDHSIRIIGSEPGEDRPLYYLSLLTAIRAARDDIGLSTGYFVPTHQQREELARAARRGVRVRLILPGHSDSADALAVGRAAYGDLLEAGVRIYETKGAVLHSKVAVVDGVWLAIGSSNLDRRSAALNNEIDAIILGRGTAAAVDAMLDRDAARATPIDLATWRQRPFGERVHEFGARFWEWLL